LKEIARGRLSKEIATSLGMSVFGVQNVRRRITRKNGLKSVAQLTLYAATLQLIPEPQER
jgi:DNA-binding CsgD family transcriptional regulator